MDQDTLTRDETSTLIAADKVAGTAVYNRNNDKLGSVEDVMIDKISGKVVYAVMSFGGFLGIGKRYHPLPWSRLRYDTQRGGYVLDIDKDTLLKAPTFGAEDTPDYSDRAWGARIHDYYDVPPYWN